MNVDPSGLAVTGSLVADAPVRKQRRWWLYALLALLVLAITGILLVIAAVRYRDYLIATYTQTQPGVLPALDTSPAVLKQLKGSWAAFAKAVEAGQTAPLRITADDLNVFVAENMPPLKDQFRFRIERGQLRGQFTFPLERSGQQKLKGRYLNGVATFTLLFQDGWLTLSLAGVEANGKPIPRWILSRVQKQNLLRDFDHNVELAEFLQQIESIAVKDGAIIVQPSASR